jgi:hypothetical protein
MSSNVLYLRLHTIWIFSNKALKMQTVQTKNQQPLFITCISLVTAFICKICEVAYIGIPTNYKINFILKQPWNNYDYA